LTTSKTQTYSKFWLILTLLMTFSVGILLGIKLQSQKMVAIVQPTKIEEMLRFTESWYMDEIDRDQLIQRTIDKVKADKKPFSKNEKTDATIVKFIENIDKNQEGSGLDVAIIKDTLLLLKPAKAEMTLLRSPNK